MTKLTNMKNSIEEGIEYHINSILENKLGIIDKFRADVAGENSSPTFIIEWSGRIIEAEFGYTQVSLILKRIDRMTITESIQITVERLEEQLLDNYFSTNSTSPFANAVKGSQGAAASSLLHTLKNLLNALNSTVKE